MNTKSKNGHSNIVFSINSKIFYPSHGAGRIKSEKVIEFQGEQKKYYEFELIDSPLTISTPVENMNRLGIRPVLKVEEIKSKVKELTKHNELKPDAPDYNDIIEQIEELDKDGKIDSYIKIIQLCNFVKSARNLEGRLIPISISKYSKNAFNHIIGEVAVSGDITMDQAREMIGKLIDVNLS